MVTTRKDLDRQRIILDKPTNVNVTIVDKDPIPGSRGIDKRKSAKQGHTDIEHTYVMQKIVDNEDGPVVTDKDDNVWSHTERITASVDNDNPGVGILLKPNGVFDTAIANYYTSNALIQEFISQYLFPSAPKLYDFSTTGTWGFTSLVDAYAATLVYYTNVYEHYGYYAAPEYLSSGVDLSSLVLDTSNAYSPPATHYWTGMGVYTRTLKHYESAGSTATKEPIYFYKFPATYDYLAYYNDGFSSSNVGQTTATNMWAAMPAMVDIGFDPDDPSTYDVVGNYEQIASPNHFFVWGIISGPSRFQLRWSENGLWKPNTDETYLSKYTGGVSILRLKLASDTSRIMMIRPSNTGGFLLYEVDGSDNAIGLVRVFRYDRTLAAVVTADQLPAYLPR